jgi:hypothetical protein
LKQVNSLRVAAALACVVVAPAWAEPADYVAVPQVVSGEREIDFKAGSAQQPPADRFGAASIGFGYGINDFWATEFYLKYEKQGSDPAHYDAVEWENKFQLTEPGKYAADLGLLTEIEVPRDRASGYELRVGLLTQTEFGKLQLNGNLLLLRSVRAEALQETDLGYQWQAKYRWLPAFEYGFQGFGELGKWNDWVGHQDQTHRAGPAIFGMWGLGGRQRIKYNAAWLVGLTTAAPDHTARLQIEYEF